MSALRICFIGDSITTGTGDETMAGWPGRVCAAARSEGHDITLYNLGIRGETSADIRYRWREEAVRRLPANCNALLVFAFGLNDCIVENGAKLRIELQNTVANARAVLQEAIRWLPTLMVGPAPVDDSRLPPQPIPGKELRISNLQIVRANEVLAKAAAEVAVPYLDMYARLSADELWQRLMRTGDGVHPPAPGYTLMARMFQEWAVWRELLRRSM